MWSDVMFSCLYHWSKTAGHQWSATSASASVVPLCGYHWTAASKDNKSSNACHSLSIRVHHCFLLEKGSCDRAGWGQESVRSVTNKGRVCHDWWVPIRKRPRVSTSLFPKVSVFQHPHWNATLNTKTKPELFYRLRNSSLLNIRWQKWSILITKKQKRISLEIASVSWAGSALVIKRVRLIINQK